MMYIAKKKSLGIAADNKQDVPVSMWDWIKDILITLALMVVSVLIFYTVQS